MLSGRGLCDELITRPEESYRLWCVVVCDLENLKNEEAMTRVGSQGHSKKKKSTCRTQWAILTAKFSARVKLRVRIRDMDDVSVLGALAKLRKATISFVMSIRLSVRPSFRMEHLGSHWTNFHDIRVFEYFSKMCGENSSFLKIGQE